MRRSLGVALLLAGVLSPLGCGLVLGLEDPKDRVDTTTTSTSSSNSSSTGGGGTGGSTSSTGGQGGHGGAACDPASCPGTTCAKATCDQGQCATEKAPAGTPCSEEGGRLCDGDGACVGCLTAGDCAAPNGCQAPVCVAGVCQTVNAPDGPAPAGACPNCTTSCAGAENGLCAAGACVCGDTATIAQCDGKCVDIGSDPHNCNGCGHVCGYGATCVAATCVCPAPGADCDGSGCVDFLTDAANCGRCGHVCGAGEQCSQGICAAVAQPAPTVNQTASAASGTAGSSTLTVASAAGFSVGKEILIHQSQGTGAGAWEEATVVGVVNDTLTLSAPLAHTYVLSATDHAQAVVIETYPSLDVAAGQVLSAPAWNGTTGGILAIHVTNALTIEGTVTMSGRGFRGAFNGCSGTTRYTCQRGQAGESELGAGKQSIQNNGSAGGGGSPGRDCGLAAGGSHGTSGQTGGNQTGAGDTCADTVKAPASAAGLVLGTSDLAAGMFFGGAGGEGGADEDGAYPGKGGNGGGIVLIRAGSIAVGPTGIIVSDGEAGGEGNQVACGASGSGMGGGGGGAGGAVRIMASAVKVLGNLRALGGTGGACGGSFSAGASYAGAGGKGRIAIQAPSITATTDPPYFGG